MESHYIDCLEFELEGRRYFVTGVIENNEVFHEFRDTFITNEWDEQFRLDHKDNDVLLQCAQDAMIIWYNWRIKSQYTGPLMLHM